MDSLRRLFWRWVNALRPDRAEPDLGREIASHVALLEDEYRRRGLSAADARRTARLALGGLDQTKEGHRDARSVRWFNDLRQDTRFAGRSLARTPGFTAVVIGTLALGIGANTALFSVVNSVLLNPLPYSQPEQLVTIHESKPNFATGSISYPHFLDWQKNNHTLSAMAVSRGTSFILTGLGEAERVRAEFVTSDFFPILGVTPVVGRTFLRSDDQRGAGPVALISGGFWKRKFGSAPDIVGHTLTLDGRGYAIVGVIPQDFDLLLGTFSPSEIYVPVVQWSNALLFNRGAGLGFHGIGRMKPGATISQVRADFDQVTRNLAVAYADTDKSVGAVFFPFRQSVVGDVEPVLLMLSCAVGFVLLIACANIANLLLARATGRAREFAVRTALGAGQSRLIRQVLTESVLLSALGAALGLLLANWGMRTALQHVPATIPRAAHAGIDLRVLLFTGAVAVLAGIFFGLAPAVKISRTNLRDGLKEGDRSASGSRTRAHGILVVMETGLALVLLIGTGLMLRSLVGLWEVNPGFNPDNVLTFGLSLPPSMQNASPAAIRAAYREVDSRLASTPGVEAVSMSWGAFPLDGDDEWRFWMEGHTKPTNQNDMTMALEYVVDPDYLKVMGTPLRRGRFFTSHDDEHSPPVVVVDDVFASQYFANENPVGKHIFLDSLGGNQQAEVVGVAGHVKQWGLDSDDTESLRAQLYFPFMQLPDKMMGLGTRVVLRSRGADAGAMDAVRRTVQQTDSEEVMFGTQTMNEKISSSIANRRFSMILLSLFAGLALLLSTIGIYGVISYLVGQQTREVGIRVALGAQQSDVFWMVVGKGARMALLGIAIGVAAALGLTRLMAQMLYGVGAADPLTFATVAFVQMVVALAACYIPARRAMRVDPLVALRHE